LQNIGGIDQKPKGLVKLAALREFMEANDVDIAALTECNVVWDKTNPDIWPLEQTKFWWENAHWSLTHNRKDPQVEILNAAQQREQEKNSKEYEQNENHHKKQKPY